MRKYYYISLAILGLSLFFVLIFSFDKKDINKLFRTSTVKQVSAPVLKKRNTSKSKGPYFVLILDDAGLNLNVDILSYNKPLNISVLPGSHYFKSWVNKLKAHSEHELLLHIPMASYKYKTSGLNPSMSREQIGRLLKIWGNSLKGARGANNHQGSYSTSKAHFLKKFFREYKKYSLYFIDSVTSNKSLAYDYARAFKIKALKRNFFLDNRDNINYIKKRLNMAVMHAKRYGYVVAIGHTTSRCLMAALMESKKLFKAYNIEFVKASKLIKILAH